MGSVASGHLSSRPINECRVLRRRTDLELVSPHAVFGAWCMGARCAEDGGSGHRAGAWDSRIHLIDYKNV